MSNLNLVIDLHLNSERQGPGSRDATIHALTYIDIAKKQNLKVADIGCGSGGPTIILAQNLNANISAIDIFPEFLQELDDKAKQFGLEKQIKTIQGSMDDLPFADEELDIIWSEGAIYNMGFEQGVKNWKRFLKQGGFLAVSEITWITNERPNAIEKYWVNEYPEIDIASNKFKILEENGYTPAGYFYLNEESWIKNYYKPVEARFKAFLERNGYSDLAKNVVNEYKSEMDMYQTFKEYFSYGFYIARKN